jgi:hypothetical protein
MLPCCSTRLATRRRAGEKRLLAPAPFSRAEGDVGGRLRFADIDLTRLRPWCDQSDRQCCRMSSGSAKNCNLALKVCCASCNSSLVGGVHQCGGPECSKAGPSSQCCSGTILSAAQDCTVGLTNTPCVLNEYEDPNSGAPIVLCTQNCYDAGLGRQRCGEPGCNGLPGGTSQCCVGTIQSSGKLCEGDALNAPCVLP